LAHANNPKADELLDKQFDVLDHGFIRLIDYMGSDSAIVQAARVSYGEGTKKISEDRALIRYLMRHRHTSPFEMVEFKFHVKLPIFVARQWIRHRTANVNELSGRYSIMKEEFYVPASEDIRGQSEVNKQGRSDEMVPPEVQERLVAYLNDSQKAVYDEYHGFVDEGLARELARITLPLSLYTEWYWKIDLHNLFHFLKLRLDEHAQLEIRKYARIMADVVRTVCPTAYEAFEDFVLNAVTFSAPELSILKDSLTSQTLTKDDLIACGLSKGEAGELIRKLKGLGKPEKPRELSKSSQPKDSGTPVKEQYDLTRSIQENAMRQYLSFWKGIQPVLRSAASMSQMNQTLKASANVSLSFSRGPLSSILKHTNSQMAALLAAAKPSAGLAKTLSDFTSGLNSNMGLLDKIPLSIGRALEDVHKSMGCSAYLFDVVRKSVSMDLKFPGATDFMARLLRVGWQHDIFVNKTIRRLQGESSGPVFEKLMRSVDVEKNQMLSTISTMGGLLPRIETYSEMPPPCTLNLPEIQQNEILDIELDADTPAPSTGLSSEISANIRILLKCKDIALPVDGKALISHTDKILVSVNELPWVVAIDETTLGQFIDHLFFLLYEGAGSENLRFVKKYGGVLEDSDCGFIWRFKHMRNLWFRHDPQHGKPADIERKKRELQDDLASYGLNHKPRDVKEFRQLQAKMVEDMGAFVSTLETAILKS